MVILRIPVRTPRDCGTLLVATSTQGDTGMMKKKTIWTAFAIVAATAVMSQPAAARQHGDMNPEAAAVERAAMDYLDGFYNGEADKLRRSVHPEVTKYGFMSRNGVYGGEPMSFQEMIAFADNVRETGNRPPASAPKEVRILEVLDQTAAVKVTAWWGSDYMHLAKYDGQWQIIHILWQTPPQG